MRTLFNRVLVDIAQRDERIWMILADIGYGEIEPFRDAFPDRWYNCGVAEVLCDEGVAPRKFLRIGLPDEYVSQVGTHEWLLDQYGLTAPKIAASVRNLLR